MYYHKYNRLAVSEVNIALEIKECSILLYCGLAMKFVSDHTKQRVYISHVKYIKMFILQFTLIFHLLWQQKCTKANIKE